MKHLTILHANDIHGQLAFRIDQDFVMRGGISAWDWKREAITDESCGFDSEIDELTNISVQQRL